MDDITTKDQAGDSGFMGFWRALREPRAVLAYGLFTAAGTTSYATGIGPEWTFPSAMILFFLYIGMSLVPQFLAYRKDHYRIAREYDLREAQLSQKLKRRPKRVKQRE